ncbi:hypothetical protein C8Q78DRAFT_585277 [Trametes maxima]|nr:hypothetical protein C8Q78DRAFT_585277 [Trametes maxima]
MSIPSHGTVLPLSRPCYADRRAFMESPPGSLRLLWTRFDAYPLEHMASMSWSMLRRIVLPPRSSMTPSEANEQDISPGRYCGPRPVPPAHVCPSVDPGPVPLADGTDLQNLMGRGVNLLAQEDNALAGHTGAQHTSDKCGRRMKVVKLLSIASTALCLDDPLYRTRAAFLMKKDAAEPSDRGRRSGLPQVTRSSRAVLRHSSQFPSSRA